MSDRLKQAIAVGMVRIQGQTATIAAPPNPGALTDEDWLLILQAASEVRRELESLGYTVVG